MDRTPLKIIASLVAVSLSSFAWSSFDLVLGLDFGTKSIKRFDGDSGTYLGEFGLNRMVRPRFIERGPNPGELLVVDELDTAAQYSAIHVFDYNTGVLKRTVFSFGFYLLGGIVRDSANGRFYVANKVGNLVQILDLGTDVLGGGVPVYSVVTSPFAASMDLGIADGSFIVSGLTGITANVNRTTGNVTNVTMPFTGISSAQGTFEDISERRHAIGSFSSPTIAFTNGTVNGLAEPGVFGIATGHNYSYVSTYRPGGIASIDVYSRGYRVGGIGQGILNQPGDLVVITAPEPGTMVLLGAGLVALLRRRRG